MTKLEKPVLIATIGKPHGLRGELYINSYTRNPMELSCYDILYSNDEREFRILDLYKKNKRFIILFDGINDRHAAENLHNLDLYVQRQDFPDEELEEDEFFHTDLEGMKTFDSQDKYWGTVCGIYDFGAGTVLELENDSLQKKFMIPFTKCAVLDINMEENRILIDPVVSGLHSMTKKDKKIGPIGTVP
ncbi:MAG: ribosome maturation factor RimM [Candidatus Liberibacter ctenarytainae]|uniref:Ribosome maturation factor RimM n=1 Tax=Candidatus Liberibacter ctenarytainae TaxID=2020335 RepID=A0A937AEK2_9HYPH|nr:ribosome maturation factor RimM [Candidatus Liberibacter ctenarytainae]